MTTLRASELTKRFGGLTAVDHVDLEIAPGRITSLIGPNGAGKTTCFDCLTGFLEPDAGTVLLGDDDITGLEAHERARRGIGRTFQRLEVFAGLSVYENLQVAAEATRPGHTFRDVFRLRHDDDPAVAARVEDVLERLELRPLAQRMAGDLPTGTLRLVELGRALCSDPSVLLLDEIAAGLDEAETASLGRLLRDLAESGAAILLVDHDIDLVLDVSEHVHVMDFGRIIAEGHPEEVVADPAVRAAYIGTAEGAGEVHGAAAARD